MIRTPLLLLFVATLLFVASNRPLTAADWKPVEGKIMTEFAKQVDPARPLPEYPRPQFVRKDWKNLNGLWDYAVIGENDPRPEAFEGKILVPFAIESALSGVGKKVGPENRLWYQRTFEVPKNWKGKRILLNFGAVDWDSTVFLNGKEIGRHKGGYSPFFYDITDALNETGEQTLVVSVWDPTEQRGGTQPRGKQLSNPHGIWYTAVTGIWQTVWIEPVDPTRLTKIKAVANLEKSEIQLNLETANLEPGDRVEASVFARGRLIVKGGLKEGKTAITLPIRNLKPWTPGSPFLYDLKVVILRKGKTLDSVDSYFAMRESRLGKDEKGITRMLLNGKFLFQHGPLDQGWWPDGLYTAPTDKALEYDVIRTKDFGFNMLRKHVKVEPDRFYYHCDKHGILVWQDMPSGEKYIDLKDPDPERTPESDAQFRAELKEMIRSLENHPCIVMWVPFNEGWGQYNTAGIVDYCRELDPTRLVDSASGWTDRGVGDVHDIHVYPGPGVPPVEENRAVVLGEYGGLGMPVKGHTWQDDKNWGYQSFEEKESLFNRYDQLNRMMHPMIGQGLSAAVYTQTTDVEIEVNGLMTYDRKVDKFDAEKLWASNNRLQLPPPTLEMLVPTAREAASLWRWTIEQPAENWEKTEFDDSAWNEGEGGFGAKETPNTAVRTDWRSGDIWIRKSIEISEDAARHPEELLLNLFYDEDCEIYWNGELVFSIKGHVSNYVPVEMNAALKKAIQPGRNQLAIHCKQTKGWQYIDAGVQRLVPGTK